MPSFIPHSEAETKKMLDDLELDSLDQLFHLIDSDLRLKRELNLPAGVSEFEVLDTMSAFAQRNLNLSKPLVSFAGGGAYDHEIPSVLKTLGFRSEFVTAYTPYQPEVAQGVLQALFEFQTLISRVSGLEISNASLYDGASALVEAINLACAATERSTILVSDGVNPRYVETARTFAEGTGLTLNRLLLSPDLETQIREESLPQDVAAVVVGYPNYFGVIENLSLFREYCDRIGALLIVAYDPVAMALLKSPGELGADVAVAEGQPFGVPLSFGGPYLGLFSTSKRFTRLIPGRLVGETVDLEGKTAYVTTLRTREQDIRREKATSNVCTNQTLMAIWATIYLSWLGKVGFVNTAHRCYDNTRYLVDKLTSIKGVSLRNRTYLREASLELPVSVDYVIEEMATRGFLAGVKGEIEVSGETRELLIVTATEKRSKGEMDRFVDLLTEVIESAR
ncbi:glycine dehydrogenase subunit 1 [Ferrithrix thermotolerans DSM 19514]|uniref:Glycine dehydrogenase subunit 1 n=1 Tax=Ferrithrix thermotolerans DSM 19514 TaxID=1121881 RepID=A0A1M4UFC1_9ACTN|nr:aminomethyl-transferring glycine dehydrogenase subunit GcvPA [Ferrithrix thermotolerans]SHE55491.1 glycine dehydrogenase subunit 1 [Ferrithrix thermotolerans DSM 19514]